jgi:hypothetical protein
MSYGKGNTCRPSVLLAPFVTAIFRRVRRREWLDGTDDTFRPRINPGDQIAEPARSGFVVVQARRAPPLSIIQKLRPRLQNFDPLQLVVWQIENIDNRRRFRALYNGSDVGEVFNSSWAGQTMDAVIPEPLKALAIDAANECAETGCAIYTIIATTDAAGHRIECERLLLPFGRSDSAVEHIVAALQLAGIPKSERKTVLDKFQTHANLAFAGKIEAGSTRRVPMPSSIDAPTIQPPILEGKVPDDNALVEGLDRSPILSGATGARNESRRATRQKIRKAGTIHFPRFRMTCVVRDISKSGAALEVSTTTDIPDSFALILEMESAERACSVVWRKRNRLGVRFTGTSKPRPLSR